VNSEQLLCAAMASVSHTAGLKRRAGWKRERVWAVSMMMINAC